MDLESFADRLALHEQLQIVSSASLAVGSGHIESAEGLNVYQSACAFAIEIEIANEEFVPCSFQIGPVVRD